MRLQIFDEFHYEGFKKHEFQKIQIFCQFFDVFG